MSGANSSRLSIAIIGGGRIGSAYAYQLARAGHEVTMVARPGSRRLDELQRDRGIVLTTGERADVTVSDHLDEQKPFALVIVTTLAHQVDALLPTLQRSQAQCIHFMFVTPEGARLQAAVGASRATFGMAAVVATFTSDGKLNLEVSKRKSVQGDQRWVDLFEAAGMPSQLEPHMARWLRSQTPLTIAMEGVAVAGMQHKRGATWAEARTGAKALRAGFAILRELGETPYPTSKHRMSGAPLFILTFILWAVSRSGFRQVLGQSAEEVQGLITLMAAEGKKRPALSRAVEQVLALRPGHAPQFTAARA
jgi:2-dehydropantoate 2-reductase